MAGLVAAWQLTQAGLKPVLVESRGYTGGLVAGSQLAGIAYDIGAEGWATRRPDTSQLATELGLVVEPPVRQPSWVWFDDGAFDRPIGVQARQRVLEDVLDRPVVAELT